MTVFIIAVALANAGLYHRPLYSFAAGNLDYSSLNGVLTLATLFILVVFVTASIFSLLSVASRRLIKPVCMVAALGNAVALYFVQSYGVVLDKSMMGNVFNTDVTEASSLFHPKLLNVERLSASRQQMLLPAATFLANEKTIVVLVIGEAARAQNVALYGYKRPTNPLLKESGVMALPHTRACATYTTASVLCILSHIDTGWPSSIEPLPSYLQRHGIDVIWRTRNWGEPSLKIQTFQRAADLRLGCQGESCDYDEVLLRGIDQRIQASSKDKIFVVLHQHGSHGPAYYSAYPKQFEVFKPVCKSVELHQCTNQEPVNAYDNTIIYADYFLHRTIEILKAFPQATTLLMYVSDHGESLGEYGLYLHGTPYSIAPDVQKDVPFLVWMSAAFKKKKGVPMSQLDPQAGRSDANVFHSVMGAFDMRSAIYNRQLDIFSSGAQQVHIEGFLPTRWRLTDTSEMPQDGFSTSPPLSVKYSAISASESSEGNDVRPRQRFVAHQRAQFTVNLNRQDSHGHIVVESRTTGGDFRFHGGVSE